MSFKIEWIKENKKAEKEGSRLVFEDQKLVGKKIVKLFKKKVLVTLCAPPQWGKTGVSLYVSYHMSLKKINPENVFFITGMSDRSWVSQTKERVLPCWRENVFHRNTLYKLKLRIDSLKHKKDILIIVDECHIANKKDFILGEIFEDLSLTNPRKMKMKNIKVLQISATPSNSLIDGENWENYHGKICPRMNSQYVSFERFIYEDRVKETKFLEENEECLEYLQEIKHGRPCYHFVRSVNSGPFGNLVYKKISNNMKEHCKKNDMEIFELNMTKTKSQIDKFYEDLSKEPQKHTVVLIKNMLGASKTIDDTYIGSVHESTPQKKDYSSEVQGLPGRLCGWTKRQTNGPILYCNREILEEYIRLYESGFDFENEELNWRDSRLRVKDGEVKSKDSYIRNETFNTETSISSI
tara:strand:- start:307 stop:1536 length:1230 start_codon:yes stop_codon:yes gene_type:complete